MKKNHFRPHYPDLPFLLKSIVWFFLTSIFSIAVAHVDTWIAFLRRRWYVEQDSGSQWRVVSGPHLAIMIRCLLVMKGFVRKGETRTRGQEDREGMAVGWGADYFGDLLELASNITPPGKKQRLLQNSFVRLRSEEDKNHLVTRRTHPFLILLQFSSSVLSF